MRYVMHFKRLQMTIKLFEWLRTRRGMCFAGECFWHPPGGRSNGCFDYDEFMAAYDMGITIRRWCPLEISPQQMYKMNLLSLDPFFAYCSEHQ